MTTDPSLAREAHKQYFLRSLRQGWKCFQKRDSSNAVSETTCDLNPKEIAKRFQMITQEPVMLSGVYWCLGGLALLGFDSTCQLDDGTGETGFRKRLIELVDQCYCHGTGGFKPHPDYMNSILATLSAVQACQMLGVPLTLSRRHAIRAYVGALQDSETGGFCLSHPATAPWTNEPDLRFGLCAVAVLFHINDPPSCEGIDVLSATQFILNCYNDIDGGFGSRPKDESHGGFMCCAVATLALMGTLDCLSNRLPSIRRFIRTRLHNVTENPCKTTLPSGRPGKAPDVCYAWWLLSAAVLLDAHFNTATQEAKILAPSDVRELCSGILTCQHIESGGFSRSPASALDCPDAQGDVFKFLLRQDQQTSTSRPDPFHSYFALAALSLLSHAYGDPLNLQLRPVDARVAIPLRSSPDEVPLPNVAGVNSFSSIESSS